MSGNPVHDAPMPAAADADNGYGVSSISSGRRSSGAKTRSLSTIGVMSSIPDHPVIDVAFRRPSFRPLRISNGRRRRHDRRHNGNEHSRHHH